jgi:succinylarginine dihydrolase
MREYNFDGLVGPTHNYAGLSYGNLASAEHFNSPSNPRAAALEGLDKMRLVAELGVPQAILPPLARPNLRALHQLGFRGSPTAMLEAAWQADPVLLAAVWSASSMWTANAATVSPAPDCADGKLHFSVANLSSLLHRSLEAEQTTKVLRAIFRAPDRFQVHDPLPSGSTLADEGAANHTRLAATGNGPGLELFTYGRVAFDPTRNDRARAEPQKFPARQTLEACQSIARRHQLAADRTFYLQQHPAAIDAGVFHNDVIAVGGWGLLLVHEQAYVDQALVLPQIARQFIALGGQPLQLIEFPASLLPLQDAVGSYLFNSQILLRPNGKMTLLCPAECEANPAASKALSWLLEQASPIDEVRFVNLRQSMNNGGGPACLRLRVLLSSEDAAALHQGVLWTPTLDTQLREWVQRNYRDHLAPGDLRDPQLVDEAFTAQEQLAQILGLVRETLTNE